MVAETLVEAGQQGDLGCYRGAHGPSRHLVTETLMEHIKFLVGLVELYPLS
jgi:hypothetical protein